MGHSGHGINLYGVVMILMGNVHAGEQSNLKHLSLLHRYRICQSWDHAYGLMTGLYSQGSSDCFISELFSSYAL